MSGDESDEDEDEKSEEAAPKVKLSNQEEDMRMALQAQLMGKLAGTKPKALIEKEKREAEEAERRAQAEEEARRKKEEEAQKKAQDENSDDDKP